jgi:23S rRNA (uracil1939-C5)-methyltransferase
VIEYTQQLIHKREVVADQLQRMGDIKNPVVHPVIENPAPWESRMQMTFALTRDGLPGYWTDDRKQVVRAEGCHALHPALHELFGLFELDAPPIRRVRFVVGSDPEDRMIILESREENAPEIEVDLPISVNLLLPDNEPVNLIGRSHVTYHVGERAFRVTAGAYFHPHAEMAQVLIQEVLRRLDLRGEESVLELYSGVGLLTAFIASRADWVLSVESYPPAVTDAEENTTGFDNVDLVEGTAEDVLDDLEGEFDHVVLDPTPAGLSPEAADRLGEHRAANIIYVSYDPASLGRDVKRLAAYGYRLTDVQPIDMIPQSSYVVCVATLQKR